MSRSFLTPILLPADPTTAMMAATKQYVDSKAGGGSVDEVSISATDPGATYELWVDTSTADLTDPNVARWNSAWGIVAVGRMKEEATGAAFVAGQAITDALTFTSITGRRYRTRCTVRAIALTSGAGGLWLRFGGTAWPALPDTHQYSSGQWQHIAMEASFAGDGTAKTHWVETAQPATMHFGMPTSFFYIEDCGPVTLGSQPTQPSSAWTNLTLLNGWANEPSGIQAAQYRLVGDKVEVRGSITKSGTTGTNPFNLPVGCRPPALLRQSLGVMQTGIGGSYTVRADLTTGGDLIFADYSSGAVTNPTVYLNTIQFSVTA